MNHACHVVVLGYGRAAQDLRGRLECGMVAVAVIGDGGNYLIAAIIGFS
jgi:hypothetical protein